MSRQIKFFGSLSILSTLLSFVILGVLSWSGVGTLYAYNNKVDVGNLKDRMSSIDGKLNKILEVMIKDRSLAESNKIRLDYYEKVIIKEPK